MIDRHYTPIHFVLFRIIFGVYIAWHFTALLPDASAIWSNEGMLSDASILPTYGVVPNVLFYLDHPVFVTAWVFLGALSGAMIALGYRRRVWAVIGWIVWASLLHRNPLTLNPGIPMVGWLFLALALIDEGEGFGLHRRNMKWRMEGVVFWGAWVIAGTAYTLSGIDKLQSPSWIDGSAIKHLLENPLARDTWLREWLLSIPSWVHKILTWGVLALEVFFGLFALFSRTRFWAWWGLLAMHLGILVLVDFADLTLGVLMLHLFMFDPRWFAPRTQGGIVFFDGVCGLCHRFVSFLIDADSQKRLRFAPLQGKRARRAGIEGDLDTVVLYEAGKTYVKSDAILRIVRGFGGLYAPIAWIASAVPKRLRDWLYDKIAQIRYRLFGKYDTCRMPQGIEEGRFLAD